MNLPNASKLLAEFDAATVSGWINIALLLLAMLAILAVVHRGADKRFYAVVAVALHVGVAITVVALGDVDLIVLYPVYVVAFMLIKPRSALLVNSISILIMGHVAALSFAETSLYVLSSLGVCAVTFLIVLRNDNYRLQMERLAVFDPLTGIRNRRIMDTALDNAVAHAQRTGIQYGLVMFDLDYFKAINDTHGHGAGDRVLVDCAQLIRKKLRAADRLYRFGGEEFVALLPNVTLAGVDTVAEKMRSQVVAYLRSPGGPVTASFGCALLHRDETAKDWLARADNALYRAKESGRNTVVVSENVDTFPGGPKLWALAPSSRASTSVDTDSRRYEQIQTLYKTDFQQVGDAFRATCDAAVRVLNLKHCASVWLFSNDDTGLYRVHISENQYSGEADSTTSDNAEILYFDADDTYIKRLQEQAVVGIQAKDATNAGLRLSSTKSTDMLHIPIHIGGSVIGVLCHECEPGRTWSKMDRTLAMRLANILALAIETDQHRRTQATSDAFRALVGQSPESIALCDSNGRLEYLNAAACRLLGVSDNESVYRFRLTDFLDAESGKQFERLFSHSKGNVWSGGLLFRSRHGGDFVGYVELRERDDTAYIACVIRANDAQDDAKSRTGTEPIQDDQVSFYIDALSGRLKEASPAMCRTLGYDTIEIENMTIFDLVNAAPGSVHRHIRAAVKRGGTLLAQRQYRHRDGHILNMETTSEAFLSDDNRSMLRVVARDLDACSKRDQGLMRHAYQDQLTGLGNSDFLDEEGQRQIAQANAQGQSIVNYLVVQIDAWQRLNDMLGYQTAESLLVGAARRIERVIGDRTVTIARLPMDAAFGLLCADANLSSRALFDEIREAFAKPVFTEGESIHLVFRAGSASYPAHAENFAQLARRAGLALQNAKSVNQVFSDYEPAHSERVHDEYLLEEDLRQAIGTEQIKVHYQPIVNAKNPCRIKGVEALVRWDHPKAGRMATCDFVELAEACGFVADLDFHVFREAVHAAAQWFPGLVLSVNCSTLTLLKPTLIDHLCQILSETELSPASLRIEVTETALMHDQHAAVQMLQQINALGIQVALDDFGTGYSSLLYLKRLPVNVLKIDMEFVRGIGVDTGDELSIDAVISLAHGLSMQVVAEGVETADQAEWLYKHGVDYLQGHYLGHALQLDELVQLVGRLK